MISNIDIRERGSGKRKTVTLAVDGVIKRQYVPARGKTTADIIAELHARIVDRGHGILVSTNSDNVVLQADAIDWGLEQTEDQSK